MSSPALSQEALAERPPWSTLILVAVAQFMVILDITIVNRRGLRGRRHGTAERTNASVDGLSRIKPGVRRRVAQLRRTRLGSAAARVAKLTGALEPLLEGLEVGISFSASRRTTRGTRTLPTP
jgi:hypothetical protein